MINFYVIASMTKIVTIVTCDISLMAKPCSLWKSKRLADFICFVIDVRVRHGESVISINTFQISVTI